MATLNSGGGIRGVGVTTTFVQDCRYDLGTAGKFFSDPTIIIEALSGKTVGQVPQWNNWGQY
jgi:hypothetical protein